MLQDESELVVEDATGSVQELVNDESLPTMEGFAWPLFVALQLKVGLNFREEYVFVVVLAPFGEAELGLPR